MQTYFQNFPQSDSAVHDAIQQQHPFNGPLSWTTQVSHYQKSKSNLDVTEARDSEWQWHHIQVCTSLQTDNHANNPPLSLLQTRCPSCHPTESVKALKAINIMQYQLMEYYTSF